MAQDWCYIVIPPNHKVKIDVEDLERVSARKWRVTKGTTGRLRVITSVRGPKGARSITLGHFLMNPPEGKQVYPRRFNEGLDYRKQNLVVCTIEERQRQLPKKRSQATSEYRGVSFDKRLKKWRARIEVHRRTISLGHYDTEEDAAEAYNRAALEHFGKDAYQNRIRKTFKRSGEAA